ncbi:MAG: phosphoribosylglycinamide formyltransferase [Planctomycetota bacterium]
MPETKPKLAVLISGGGRTMVNLAERCRGGTLDAEIAVVIASRECAGVERAQELGLPTLVRQGGVTSGELESLAAMLGFEWILLAGYLRKLDVPRGFGDRVLNIHPALLPGDGTAGPFGGPGMYGHRVHAAVIESGATESGCTVHRVTSEYDAGEVILTRSCPVLPSDTPESLAARVFELELEAFPEALKLVLSNARTGA